MQRNIATIISRVFDPQVSMTVALVLISLQAGVTPWHTLLWLTIFIVPPTALRLWAKKTQGLDWDIKKRERRIAPLFILLVLVIIDIVLLLWFGPVVLTELFLLFVIWVFGFAIITLITKISGHASSNALATGLIIQWFGWQWWPVLLVVPLVAYARVVTKNHTIPQVILGGLYSWILLVVFDNWIIR